MSGRDKLVNLLDREVFRPILNTSPDKFSGRDQEIFEEIRDKTERTREKYRKDYGSAERVYEMYRSDLSSGPAQEVTRKSRRLGLPAFEDVDEKMTDMAKEVGIRASGG